jgi:dihydropyrimidinase
MDLIVAGGTVVTASDTFRADVGVRDGRVVQIGRDLDHAGAKLLDATDKYVLPGGIDTHTHLDMPFGGTVTADDFRTGTIAAACGGTTSIVDFCIPAKGQSLADALKGWHARADGRAAIDYGFHSVIVEMSSTCSRSCSPMARPIRCTTRPADHRASRPRRPLARSLSPRR